MDITPEDLKLILNPELDPVQNERRLKTLARVRAMAASGELRRTPQGIVQDPDRRETRPT